MAVFVLYVQNLSVHGIEYRDDEIFYFKSTKEMVQNHNYLSPTYFGEERFQKPILFYWFVIFFYQLLGISWFSARIISVIFAALSVAFTWRMARDMFDEHTAHLSALILVTIPMFFRHAKNVVPDMALNFFIVSAIYCAYKFTACPDNKIYRNMFFVLCGLGFMVKGYTAVIVPLITVIGFSLASRQLSTLKKINFPLGIVILGCIILPWFIYMMKEHGKEYIDYMFQIETKGRLLPKKGNMLLNLLQSFSNNSVFYLNVIFSYFAPLSIFGLGAVPFAFTQSKKIRDEKESIYWLLCWTVSVFIFFSFVAISINHYMLALSTPFAIMIALFLLRMGEWPSWVRTMTHALIILILVLGVAGLSFFQVFLAGASKLWLIIYSLVLLVSVATVIQRKDYMTAPGLLGGLIVLFIFQSHIMGDAGVAPHATLQSFANIINREVDDASVIAVGSHDIHEKEFQVYFDKKIWKEETKFEPVQRVKLEEILGLNRKVFCLITEEDYRNNYEQFKENHFGVIQEDYLFRKRLSLDSSFALSLLTLNREQIHRYLMEKILLLRKDGNA